MAGDTGLIAGTHNIVIAGKVPVVTQHEITTVANMYPGRLVAKDSTDFDIKVCTALLRPRGWLGFEQAPADFQPISKDTIYLVNDMAPVLRGGGFIIEASLALGCNAILDDLAGNWAAGQVVAPVMPADGGFWLGIPWSNTLSAGVEYDTGIDLPQYMRVRDVIIEVTTAGAGTINVGLLSSEGGGDLDGFLDAESYAALGFANHVMAASTTNAITLGAFLEEEEILHYGTLSSTIVYVESVPKMYVCDGTAKSVTYQTDNVAGAGRIWLHLVHSGLMVVGKSEQAVDATSVAADMLTMSYI